MVTPPHGGHLQRLFRREQSRKMAHDSKCIKFLARRLTNEIHPGTGTVQDCGSVVETQTTKQTERRLWYHTQLIVTLTA